MNFKMLPAKYGKNPVTTFPLVTHFCCSPAKHLGGSFPSLLTWEQGERALSCNKSHLLGKAECCVPSLLQSFDRERVCFPRRALEDLLHPILLSFLEQGDPSFSVSCERKDTVLIM